MAKPVVIYGLRWRKVDGGAVLERRTKARFFGRWKEVANIDSKALELVAKVPGGLTQLTSSILEHKGFEGRMEGGAGD